MGVKRTEKNKGHDGRGRWHIIKIAIKTMSQQKNVSRNGHHAIKSTVPEKCLRSQHYNH